ncbi:MAG: signal peptidase I [Oscillospiraceae bacterium]|nr:signal peptidase I [Oscillospiraceae bacterium]
MKVLKKIVNVIIDIIVVLILLISATILTVTLTTNQDTGAPNVFGYTLNTIQSQSMEPVMHKGDLIIGKIVDETTPEFKVGDIVIYTTTKQLDDGTNQYVLVCHRIVKTKVEGETTYYLTKGDNNEVSDAETVGWLTSDKIVGVYENSEYKGTLLKGVGSIYDYLLDFWGFFFVIVLPMILFFIYELIRVIMNIVAYTKEKALVAASEAAQSAELTEAQKQKAIEEYLASQKANENPDKPDTNEKEE